MIWRIRVTKTVEKQLRRVPKKDIDCIADAIDEMGNNPFQGDIIKLSDEDNVWRRRIGNYRVKYRLFIDGKFIDIYDIRRRTSNTY